MEMRLDPALLSWKRQLPVETLVINVLGIKVTSKLQGSSLRLGRYINTILPFEPL